jgi:hypothetical protein
VVFVRAGNADAGRRLEVATEEAGSARRPVRSRMPVRRPAALTRSLAGASAPDGCCRHGVTRMDRP